MENDKREGYKGFNNHLTKEDLDEEELECYDRLMEGINKASSEEKEDIAHLMDIAVEAEETDYINCVRCGGEFTDKYEDLNDGNKRVYCNDCLKVMWGARTREE